MSYLYSFTIYTLKIRQDWGLYLIFLSTPIFGQGWNFLMYQKSPPLTIWKWSETHVIRSKVKWEVWDFIDSLSSKTKNAHVSGLTCVVSLSTLRMWSARKDVALPVWIAAIVILADGRVVSQDSSVTGTGFELTNANNTCFWVPLPTVPRSSSVSFWCDITCKLAIMTKYYSDVTIV